jgi:hypothetical protein
MADRSQIADWLRSRRPEVNEERRLKGDDGFRSTREVAEWAGVSMSRARRLLWDLVEDGLVEAFDGGASGLTGNPIEWRATLEPTDVR